MHKLLFCIIVTVQGCAQEDPLSEASQLLNFVKEKSTLASRGDSVAALELWKMGSVIDKTENLKNIAPLDKRFKFLEEAAKSGDSDACYLYAVHMMLNGNDKAFIENINRAAQKRHVMGAVVYSIILAFHENKTEEAVAILGGIQELVPASNSDVFDSQINLKSLRLLIESIQSGNLETLRSKSKKDNETRILESIQLFNMYADMHTR